jgi:type IV pilus assembly protein PilE
MNKLDSPRKNRSRIRTQQGFTLVELLIAMAITAILAAIAIPSYSAYIQKSRRTEAKSALLDLASLEERYFSTNNTYTNQASNLGYSAGTATPFAVGSGYYNITSITVTAAAAPTGPTSVGTPASYLITATPVAGTTQANDLACASFTISSTGQQTATGTDTNASTDCWQ